MRISQGTVLRLAATVTLLLWAWLVYIYFLRTNTVLLHHPAQPFGIFGALLGSYTFSLANTPPLEMIQVLVATIMAGYLGCLVLRILGLRLRWWEEIPLGYTLGFGVAGVALVLLTMAGLLYTITTWILMLGLLGGAWWLSRRPPVLFNERLPATDFDATEPDFVALWRNQPMWRKASTIVLAALALLITGTTFWHAVFFPETYWDSLILYLGYGRMTFLENAFPFKAEAQVGIGLGANYPHLYSTWGAGASMLFNNWSDLHQRFAAPLAGLVAMVLVYHTCLRVWRDHLVASMAALLYRALPNGLAYTTYASDYAFAILFCAMFLHAMVIFLQRRTWGTYALFTLVPAISMHLNYLMGILWLPWLVVMILLPLLSRGRTAGWRFGHLVLHRRIWAIYLVAIVIATPWYIRNTVLTGNPVYSFFPEIFTASVRINPEVLRSAELEWFRNGDGIGRLAELHRDWEVGDERDEGSPEYRREASLRHRISASHTFWMGFDIIRPTETEIRVGSWPWRAMHLLHVFSADPVETRPLSKNVFLFRYHHSYKMMPLFPALLFPAIAAWIIWLALRAGRRRLALDPVEAIAIVGTLVVVLSHLGYMYILADFYLYQIIGMIGPAAVLAGGLIALAARGFRHQWFLAALVPMMVFMAISPGMTFGLMGFKFSRGNAVVYGQQYSPFALDAFRNPGLPPPLFLRMQYGESPDVWDHINANLQGERLLTHENRHYVFDPSITLVHLDDWDIQQGYDLENPEEIYRFLRDQNLEYYLRTENEARHHINSRLGMHLLEEAGCLERILTAGTDVLFRLRAPTGD
ncbi:MAG: glycosyltransferase family 39 protein [Candidatus Sumerlaeia bacterium]|nr:glycosyltransferase family 39 protein [Candidatus Sumerlaeia bacterium]